jgi:hypothetical protein|tara:strand:- start:672 stop:1433 length:762 start_codon:yes stop_codon:yes gene_type:complete
MKRSLKLIVGGLLSFVLGVSIGLGVIYSVQQSVTAVSIGHLGQINNVAEALTSSQQRAVRTSRSSAVRVMSLSADQQLFSSATGTYFTAYGRYFVLTVKHGIQGPCELTRVEASDEFVNCIQYVDLNDKIDYAIFEVEKLETRTPVKIPRNLGKGNRDFAIMTGVYYTGFPNGTGPLTLDGKIIGYMGGDFIYVKSYAWSGSSGAGVFASNGKLIGYVLALDVGYTEYGIDVLEDILFVVPVTAIRWDSLREE